MAFVKLRKTGHGAVSPAGMSARLSQTAKGKVNVEIYFGADILKKHRLKIGDKLVVEAGCAEDDGKLRLARDPLGRTISRYSKSETGLLNIRAWRAFAVTKSEAIACPITAEGDGFQPSFTIQLPESWTASAPASDSKGQGFSMFAKRDVTGAVTGPNGGGGRR